MSFCSEVAADPNHVLPMSSLKLVAFKNISCMFVTSSTSHLEIPVPLNSVAFKNMRNIVLTDDDEDKDNKIHDANSRSVVIKKAFDGMILYTFALYNNFTFSSSRSSFPRKTSSFFLFWYEPTENHTHHRIKRIMSDEEFDLKKKKKKSKKDRKSVV